MKRIGLTQRVEIIADYGERRDCLDQKWAALMLSLGYCPVPLANNVHDVAAYLDALQIEGIVITGGNDLCEADGGINLAPERDRLEHSLLELSAQMKLPVLGVCRGLQILNVHYGGAVVSVDSHINHSHDVTLEPGVFSDWPDSIKANSYHGFGIEDRGLSPDLKVIGRADDGTIEAVANESLGHFGIMWHPEREEPFMRHDLSMIREVFGRE